MRIALTGSTGFIGSRLSARLARDGHALTLLCRRPPTAPTPGATVISGGLENHAALEELVRDADIVIHLAAVVRGASAVDFYGPNVEGTRNLLAAMARQAPATPMLFVSSLAAREPGLSFYAGSKHAAEDLVREARGAHPTLILRPPAVYGPGDTEMLPVFRFMARTGFAPCAGSPEQRLSLIHVDDLVGAIACWCSGRSPYSGTLCIDDGKPGGYVWQELADITARVCGRRVRVWQVPAVALDTIARLNLLLARLGGPAPMLSPGKLRELRHLDWVCNVDGDGVTLPGWHPGIGLETGLRSTPGWR